MQNNGFRGRFLSGLLCGCLGLFSACSTDVEYLRAGRRGVAGDQPQAGAGGDAGSSQGGTAGDGGSDIVDAAADDGPDAPLTDPPDGCVSGGWALSFSGAGSRVTIPNPTVGSMLTVLPTSAAPRTVEMWIYVKVPQPDSGVPVPDWSPDHTVFAYGGAMALQTFALDMDLYPQMELYVIPASNSLLFSTAPTVSTERWFHVASTYDGTRTRAIVDGIERGNLMPSGALQTSASILQIGGAIGRNWFIGMIDEVRVWKVARTVFQIQQSMSVRLKGNEPNLVGYWRFDEGRGTTVADSSSSGNAGLLEPSTSVGTPPVWVCSGVKLECP